MLLYSIVQLYLRAVPDVREVAPDSRLTGLRETFRA